MAFTYNIASGLTAGLVLHPVMKLMTGRWRDVRAGSVVLALLCLLYYVFGIVHWWETGGYPRGRGSGVRGRAPNRPLSPPSPDPRAPTPRPEPARSFQTPG